MAVNFPKPEPIANITGTIRLEIEFTSTESTHMVEQTLQQIIKRHAPSASIRKITFEDVRPILLDKDKNGYANSLKYWEEEQEELKKESDNGK